MNKRFDGAVGLSTLTVRHADTAIALGSGDVTVLGTPRLIALAEAATVAALQDRPAASRARWMAGSQVVLMRRPPR